MQPWCRRVEQAVARWIKETNEGEPAFSAYIQEAIDYSDKSGTEIIMAMDLADVLDEARVKEELKDSEVISKAGLDVEAVSRVLMSLHGAMLGVTFGEKPFGSIKVDFGADASLLKDVGAELLLEVLAKQGATIDDFATWKAKVDGKQMTLSGNLSADGMRKIFSLIDAPTAATVVAEKTGDQSSASDQDSTVVASQKYFSSVNQYIKDLRDKEPQRIAQYGIWFDKYARKIDQLPMVNVDTDMLDYGAYVAQQFRNAGTAIQGIGVRSRVRQVENVNAAGGPGYWGSGYDGGGYYYGGSYYRGGYGYGGGYARANAVQSGLRQQQRIRTQVNVQEKAKGTSAACAIIKDIDNASAVVRREMTQKYNAEF